MYDEEMTSVVPPVGEQSAQGVMDLEKAHLLQNYARYPLLITRGKGSYVYDSQGRRYLDFITGIGVNALGHAHPRIVKTIREQAAQLIHSSNLYYHPYQGPLAERLARKGPTSTDSQMKSTARQRSAQMNGLCHSATTRIAMGPTSRPSRNKAFT